MLHNLSPVELAFVGFGAVSLYIIILALVYGKRLFSKWGHLLGNSVATAIATPNRPAGKIDNTDLFPPLIDRPVDHPMEEARGYGRSEDAYAYFEADEDADEGFTTLLKEAEKVVERIQYVVEHIESSPANPEEVKSKIQAVVSNYRIFCETEYYEAINSFISITVERDCNLRLAEPELHELWTRRAA